MDHERFRSAPAFSDYLETVEKNRPLWLSSARRAVVDDRTAQRARAIPGLWHVVALTEDWCGDAINILPVFDRLAGLAENVELRILLRDENPDLMDAHLTNGTSRSIPILIVYDEAFRERGWWGPRPAPGRTALDEFLSLLESAAPETASDGS